MFRRLQVLSSPLILYVDDVPIQVAEGDNVLTALLCSGKVAIRRTAVTDSLRGAFCGMGVCFDCLVTIDGEGNRQACLTKVRNGMRVYTGMGRRALSREV